MAVDISLLIVRRADGLVVAERWIGMGQTRDRMFDVLNDAQPMANDGIESYAATPEQVRHVAESRYADGVTIEEIDAYALTFPEASHAWRLIKS